MNVYGVLYMLMYINMIYSELENLPFCMKKGLIRLYQTYAFNMSEV